MGRIKEWLHDCTVQLTINPADADELLPSLRMWRDCNHPTDQRWAAEFLIEALEDTGEGGRISTDGHLAYELADAFELIAKGPAQPRSWHASQQYLRLIVLAAKYQAVVSAAIKDAFEAE